MSEQLVRLECRNPAADHVIGGIRFGTLSAADSDVGRVLLSEPIPLAEAQALTALDGFTLSRTVADELAERVDAEIAAARAAEETGLRPGGASAQELSEHQAANQALAAELTAAHARIAELERLNGPARLQALEDENTHLAAELRAARDGAGDPEQAARLTARIEELVAERDTLKAANEALAKDGSKKGGKAAKAEPVA